MRLSRLCASRECICDRARDGRAHKYRNLAFFFFFSVLLVVDKIQREKNGNDMCV